MTKRVVFAGGAQAKALARAYRGEVAVDRDEDVFFIGPEAIAREAAHRVIGAADIVVTEVTEAGETVPERLVPANAERIGVPVVSGAFLWPYAGRPHPRNRGIATMPDGPYPADFGDSFLDGMIAVSTSEDEAVQRYLALDVAADADLDGRLADKLAALARLDRQTGFDLADFIGANFRTGNLFATSTRLRLKLFRHVAGTVLERMGVGGERAETLLEAPFAAGAAPIHPGVLRHFGMQAPLPDHRYPILDEGLFTFEQHCRRYFRYEWNERLHVAISLAESSPAEAVAPLRRALEDSPGSKAGQEALEEAERAVAELRDQPKLALGDGRTPPEAPSGSASMYAAPDAPLLPTDLRPRLVQVPRMAPPPAPAVANEPLFATSSFGGLPFSPTHAMPEQQAGRSDESNASPVPALAANETQDDEPQLYVELPHSVFGRAGEPVQVAAAAEPEPTGRYKMLAPAAELIEVLPRMLPSNARLSGAADSPFATMPETMPPPPLRPILPPEVQPEPERRGFVARLFGRNA